MTKYFYISLNHTHKKDKWFTLWRPESKGYCFYKEWAGIYSESIIDDHVLAITESLANEHFITLEYEGEMRTVLPNNVFTRSAFGIDLHELLSNKPYIF